MASNVDWALLDHAATEPVRIGDMVSAEPGGMPIWRVTAFVHGRAWLAGEAGGLPQARALDGFLWKGMAA
jgi:hypothetical protein